MPDITHLDSERLRELSRILAGEEQLTAGSTPAGALTTIGAALPGSLIAECHGAVALDILAAQESVAPRFDTAVDALVAAAGLIDDREWATTSGLGLVGPPR